MTKIYLSSPTGYKAQVVGEQSYQSNIERMVFPDDEKKTFREDGFTATLVLEDQNPHDPNAVRVDIENKTVGYLSSADAKRYRKELARLEIPTVNAQCGAIIYGKREDEYADWNFGVWLEVDLKLLVIERLRPRTAAIEPKTQPAPVKPALVKKETPLIQKIIVYGIAFFVICSLVIEAAKMTMESAGMLPTRTPAPTATQYSLYATFTAEALRPTRTPYPTVTPLPTFTPQRLAWTACESFIETQLKLPKSAAQTYNPNGVIQAGTDYLVDIYYAQNNVTYTCFLSHANNNWTLLRIEKK